MTKGMDEWLVFTSHRIYILQQRKGVPEEVKEISVEGLLGSAGLHLFTLLDLGRGGGGGGDGIYHW